MPRLRRGLMLRAPLPLLVLRLLLGRPGVVCCGLAALPALLAPAVSMAQGTPAPQKASATQVATGRAVYLRDCARCHGPIGGKGETAPALIGEEIAQKIAAFQTASVLFTFVRFAMPQDKPGSLPEEDYWAVLAFVLASNGFIEEHAALGPATAAGIALKR